jgi:hypothetical protein
MTCGHHARASARKRPSAGAGRQLSQYTLGRIASPYDAASAATKRPDAGPVSCSGVGCRTVGRCAGRLPGASWRRCLRPRRGDHDHVQQGVDAAQRDLHRRRRGRLHRQRRERRLGLPGRLLRLARPARGRPRHQRHLARRALRRRARAGDRARSQRAAPLRQQHPYYHYSLLRTIEDAWNLPELGFTSDHAQVTTMNEFLGP